MSLEVSTYEKKVFLALSIFFFITGLIVFVCIYTNNFELIIENKKIFTYATITFISLGIIFFILYLVSNSKGISTIKTYDCIENKCIENTKGNGAYSNLGDCQNSNCSNTTNKPLILGYWENWDAQNNYNTPTYCQNIGCTPENYFKNKTKYYTTINWSFVLLSKFWYSGYKDPKDECRSYNSCGGGACPACIIKSKDGTYTYTNYPVDALRVIPGCRIDYSNFIDTKSTVDNLGDDLKVARETCRLAHKYGKKFNISFGGWSDCITLQDETSNGILATLISNTILYTFSDGVDLDFEHFTQLSPLSYPNTNELELLYRPAAQASQQLKLFANLVSKIRINLNNITTKDWNDTVNKYDEDITYKNKLLNNKPTFTISFTCRYNSFITNEDLYNNFGFTNKTSAEGLQIMRFDNTFIDSIDYVNLMIYDESSIKGNYQTFYETVVKLTIKANVPASKILCGIEPGKQAGAPNVPSEDSSIPDIGKIVLTNKLGGIFFWAINEKSEIQNDFGNYLQPLYTSFGYKESGGGGDGGGGGDAGDVGLCTEHVSGSHPCVNGNCVNGKCVCKDPTCKDLYCNCK